MNDKGDINMCSICDHTKYIEDEKVVHGKTIKFLKADEKHLGINMNCDPNGKNFKVGDFTIYHCPTCGRQLF